MNSCCKDCEEKYEGCHDRCIRYSAEWLVDSERKDEIYKNRSKENLRVSSEVRSILRAKKKKRR